MSAARAHGPAPVALEVLAHDGRVPTVLRTNLGLAVANGDGTYAYVCPSRWDGNELALAAAARGGDAILVESTGVAYLSTDRGCTFERLTDIGISFTASGTLSISSSKLTDALGNLPELRKVLAADGTDTASSGFIDRFKDFASSVLGAEGAFENRTASLKGQISLNQKSQESMERRLTQTEERLRRQYQALDTAMSSLSGTADYLTQQLTLIANTSSRG